MNTILDTRFAPKSKKTVRYIGRCAYKKTCGHIKTLEGPESHGYLPSQYLPDGGQKCPECNRWGMDWRQVKATVTNHKCDARCTGAKGHSCDCSCGGANHGSDWL